MSENSENKDIRWIQRFSNYKKALNKLSDGVNLSKQRELSELEKQGLIQSFEYTFELGWKTLQDFLREKGYTDISGPRAVIETAFGDDYIDGEVWAAMNISRGRTSHTYDEDIAEEIFELIVSEYIIEFNNLSEILSKEE